MLYHAVDARRPRAKPDAEINTRRVMLLDRIVWKDGWPVLATGGPSEGPQPRPPAPADR
jgi:arabinan endo-1,5-alpha-L-arabinosidase